MQLKVIFVINICNLTRVKLFDFLLSLFLKQYNFTSLLLEIMLTQCLITP